MALKALTAAAAQQSRDLDAQIDVLVNGELVYTFTVNAANFDVLQMAELTSVRTVTLRQQGRGRVLYQLVHAFNVPVNPLPPESDVVLRVAYSASHVAVDDIVDVSVSVLYSGEAEQTGMAIVDVSVPTGFAVVPESLQRVQSLAGISRIEQAGRKIIFYLDHLVRATPVEFTFQVQALYPVRADGGSSTAYLYYDPDSRAEASVGNLVVE